MKREPLIVEVPTTISRVVETLARWDREAVAKKKEPRPKPCLPWDKAIALLLLMACASPCPPPSDAGIVPRPSPAPMVPDDVSGQPESSDDLPCVRAEVVWVGKARVAVELPCRPYDRFRDLPDPPASPGP